MQLGHKYLSSIGMIAERNSCKYLGVFQLRSPLQSVIKGSILVSFSKGVFLILRTGISRNVCTEMTGQRIKKSHCSQLNILLYFILAQKIKSHTIKEFSKSSNYPKFNIWNPKLKRSYKKLS